MILDPILIDRGFLEFVLSEFRAGNEHEMDNVYR